MANLGAAIAQLALPGLASPFLDLASDPFEGFLGRVILFVGMRFGWRFTAPRGAEFRQHSLSELWVNAVTRRIQIGGDE